MSPKLILQLLTPNQYPPPLLQILRSERLDQPQRRICEKSSFISCALNLSVQYIRWQKFQYVFCLEI